MFIAAERASLKRASEAANLIAVERASFKRASEAANLIYVYGDNLSQTTVYRSAL